MSAVAPNDADVRNIQLAPGNDASTQRAPYPSSLRVCIRHAGRDRRRSAVDVSEDGMFVESPDNVTPGEAVQIVIAMPEERTIRALATVERVVTPEEASFCGGMPGMGLRFLMMDRCLGDWWNAYLEQLAETTRRKQPDPAALEHRGEPAGTRRVEPRNPGRFQVEILDEATRQTFYTRDVSPGGMFLATPDVREVGERLRLVVGHPVSEREFPLPGEGRWTRTSGPVEQRGMGIRLLIRDTAHGETFLRFINEG